MTSTSGHLTKLVALAKETSSEKRRELLRDITDLFISEPEVRAGAAGEHADQILTAVAADVAESVRAELAERFADAEHAPAGLVNQLAHDAIEVARPLLERGATLSKDDLVSVAYKQGEQHLTAIAGRSGLEREVAEVVAERGEGDALVALASNTTAELSRSAMETLVDKSQENSALHAPLVSREEMPPDLLNEMYVVVEEKLRENISQRLDNVSEEEMNAAFEAARNRLKLSAGAPPADYEEAVKFINVKKLRKKMTPALLGELLEKEERTKFVVGLAELTELDFNAAMKVADNPKVDSLAIACRAVEMARDDFLAIAMFRKTDGTRNEANVDALGDIYDALPLDAAQRAMRFWRVRQDSRNAA